MIFILGIIVLLVGAVFFVGLMYAVLLIIAIPIKFVQHLRDDRRAAQERYAPDEYSAEVITEEITPSSPRVRDLKTTGHDIEEV
jgi:hypothetical protein